MANLFLGHLRLTPPKILSLGFMLLIAAGTVLLCLPAASTGDRISFIDALFMATSATCVTGLAVIDTGTQLTVFGQIVLLGAVPVRRSRICDHGHADYTCTQ